MLTRVELTEKDFKNILGWCETKFDSDLTTNTPDISTKIKVMAILITLQERRGKLPISRGPF